MRTPCPVCTLIVGLLSVGAAAAAPAATQDRSIPIAPTLGFEVVRLPGSERMGLLGGSLLFNAGGAWWLGPGVYAAASGERGGLYVGGAELQHRWRLGSEQLVAGVFAGGGGGAAAPVGGGLMLRPALTWLHDFGPLQAGLSLSAVRFPSGSISSRQIGVVAAWNGTFRHAFADQVGSQAPDAERSGLGVDRLLGTITRYALRGRNVDPRTIGLVGVRLEQELDGGGYVGMEAAGAASGGAAGYMEMLGTAGWGFALTGEGAVRLGGRAAIGLAGGGGVPTGGGPVAKLALDVSISLSPLWRTGLELGGMRSLDSPLHATTVQWWFAVPLEPARHGFQEQTVRLKRIEWTAALQHYAHAERKDGGSPSLDTVGLKMALYAGEHVYGTGQAHTAFAGGAGAYSVGIVGVGLATSARDRTWRIGAELLAGAAGGGGVASGGGAIVQALGWAAFTVARDVELRAGLGAVRSRAQGLSTPIVELSISRAFGQAVP